MCTNQDLPHLNKNNLITVFIFRHWRIYVYWQKSYLFIWYQRELMQNTGLFKNEEK